MMDARGLIELLRSQADKNSGLPGGLVYATPLLLQDAAKTIEDLLQRVYDMQAHATRCNRREDALVRTLDQIHALSVHSTPMTEGET